MTRRRHRFSTAHLFCAAAYALAAILALWDWRLSMIPLSLFLITCLAAPLFTGWGFYLPIIRSGSRSEKNVALTFDDGPDPVVTPLVLKLLMKHNLKCTFFVAGNRAEAHPDIIKKILSQGHSIGNHTYTHTPLLMLKGYRTLKKDVDAAQDLLKGFGIVPLAFRPPAGITNPKLRRVLDENGLYCVNFSRRAGDMGNRRISRLSERILARIRPGDIVLLHDCAPGYAAEVGHLLCEFESLISGISEKGLAILPLEQVIERSVMMIR